MRVFWRGVNESLQIGEKTSVTVLEVNNDHIRLGISDPDGSPAYREETIFLEDAERLCEPELQLR